MKQIFLASAVLAGALAYLPASADARPMGVGGSGGLGGGNFRSALGAGGVSGFGRGGGFAGGGFRGGGAGIGGGGFRGGGAGLAGGGFRGGGVGLAGGGFRGGGLAGRPGFGVGRPGYGVAGVRPGFGNRGWYGGNRWRNAGFYRRGYGYGGLGLGLGVGAGLGLAAGGLYGSSYGYPGYGYGGYGYDDGYYAPAGYYGTETVTTGVAPGGDEDLVAECARRFKTYDPQTQTYAVRRGVRRSCP
ncbi:hypothetical protein ASF53_12170 [Methylobacterium sp. Leaf123]|uniref:BA14K family protein n=1 Tax=Methylobacterium sp. Leaf123 TaxID=1736264 RepID=UPI0006F33DCD|nr:BA14K family protein [Methylobacterium sp. Leaf123]KQQ13349.1 hypothetical protein ASF53_12170 [Methylobacterium sp. Leaf123]